MTMANGLPDRARMGTILRASDGKNYQYAETTGMAGATGPTGWIHTTMAPTNNFLGNLNPDMLMALSSGLLSGNSASEQIGGALGNFATYRQQSKQKNATLDYLQKNSPELLPMLDAGMSPSDLLSLSYKQKRETEQAQLKAQEPSYMAVGKNLFDRRTGQWMSPPAGIAGADDGDEWSLNPVWGKDGSGKTVLGQISKTGKFKPLDTGDFMPTPGIDNVNLGTTIEGRNSRTGDVVYSSPVDNQGKKRDETVGGAQGDAIVSQSGVRGLADKVRQQADNLKSDPYLSEMLGPTNSRLPNITTDAARVQGKMDQLQGDAFLQGRQMLKGGGAITDFESGKAEAAFARLSAAQSPDDYKTALDEFTYWVDEGAKKLESQASGDFGARPTQGGRLRFNPATGELE